MKQSLSELFKVTLPELHNSFDIRHQLYWAIDNLRTQISDSLYREDWQTVDESSRRRYLEKALSHYQGNLDELLSGSNTALTKRKSDSHYE